MIKSKGDSERVNDDPRSRQLSTNQIDENVTHVLDVLNSDRRMGVWFGERCLLRRCSEETEEKDCPRMKRHHCYLDTASRQYT